MPNFMSMNFMYLYVNDVLFKTIIFNDRVVYLILENHSNCN